MKLFGVCLLLAAIASSALAQLTFTGATPAWHVQYAGYKTRGGADGLVRMSASVAPSINLSSYNSSGTLVHSNTVEPWPQVKWANLTTYLPDLILDSSSNSYVVTNGPMIPSTSNFYALKFDINLNMVSSVEISAPSGSTYTEVAERLGSNGHLFVLFQKTTGSNTYGTVVEVNLSTTTGTIVGTQNTAGIADTVTSLSVLGTTSYVSGYTGTSPYWTAACWKFATGGAGPVWTYSQLTPVNEPSGYSGPMLSSQWMSVNSALVGSNSEVYLVGNYRLVATTAYGEKAWGCWTLEIKDSGTTATEQWECLPLIMDPDPQGSPAAGYNLNQGVNSQLVTSSYDGVSYIFVCDQVNEPDTGHYGIKVAKIRASDGTLMNQSAFYPTIQNPQFLVGTALCGEMTADTNEVVRFITGDDASGFAYLGEFNGHTNSTLLVKTNSIVNTPFNNSLAEGSGGQAYWLLAGYLYQFLI